MTATLVLIDGTNYAFRAFYAMAPLTTSSGLPTNAIFKYTDMLMSLVKRLRPDYLAVAFDPPVPSFRKQRFEAYKAQRRAVPPELIQQLPYFRRVTEAIGIPFLELEGYEADDVIATLATRHASPEIKVEILTTDKDLMQLVSEHITCVDTLHDKIYDAAAVEEKFGVPPSRLRDLLALQGDSSDNIPGVKGIGPKKALELLKTFGHVPELIERIPEVKNDKIRTALTTCLEDLKLSYELVGLYTDAPLDVSLEALKTMPPDPARSQPLFRELEFKKFIEQPEASARRAPLAAVQDVETEEAMDALLEALHPSIFMALSTFSSRRGLELVLSTGGASLYRIPLALLSAAARGRLSRMLSDASFGKVGHDVKEHLKRLAREGLPVRGVIGDTQIAAFLLNPSKSQPELWELASSALREEPPSGGLEAQALYAPMVIHALFLKQQGELTAQEMDELYHGLEVPLISILAGMELEGIKLEVPRLNALSTELARRLLESEERICQLAGGKLNPNSPKQLQEVLFERLGLPVVKKTKTGPSTDQSVLEALAEHPDLAPEAKALPAEIIAYRTLAKLKGTYVDALPGLVRTDTSRVHTTFHQTVASTGRLSSVDPNLQNIPIRGEEGKRIREAFVAGPGHVLMSADYSQIELRVLAHFSADESLLEAFAQGVDIHAATASEMFGVALQLVTGSMRRSAKAINFGILYGMGAYRLAQDLKISRKEAEDYINRYFARYGRVKAYLEKTVADAREKGYVTTLTRRRRYLPDLHSKDHNLRQAAERMAVNTPIQGSAADIIKKAMLTVSQALTELEPEARLLLQVHDELVLEVPEGRVESVRELVKTKMECVCELACPLIVNVNVGVNWMEAH